MNMILCWIPDSLLSLKFITDDNRNLLIVPEYLFTIRHYMEYIIHRPYLQIQFPEFDYWRAEYLRFIPREFNKTVLLQENYINKNSNYNFKQLPLFINTEDDADYEFNFVIEEYDNTIEET